MGASEQLKLSSPWFLTADGSRAALAPPAPLNKVLERFDGELQRLWEGQAVAA